MLQKECRVALRTQFSSVRVEAMSPTHQTQQTSDRLCEMCIKRSHKRFQSGAEDGVQRLRLRVWAHRVGKEARPSGKFGMWLGGKQ